MALKAAYPTLPMTSNCHDSRQRAQLLRSSKKLAKLLGATPRFVEVQPNEPGYVFCESKDSFEDASSYAPSVTSSRPSTASSISSLSELFPRAGGRHARTSSEPPSPTRPDTPLMRVALPPSERMFSSRPGRLSYRASTISTSSSSSSASLSSASSPPRFRIPTSQHQKRAKMDRLRRKFGDEIPVALVFPTASADDESDSCASSLSLCTVEEEDVQAAQPASRPRVISERGAQFVLVQSPSDLEKPLPFLPPPSPPAHAQKTSSPRDSLLIHRIRRKTVCYPVEGFNGVSSKEKAELSLIAECP